MKQSSTQNKDLTKWSAIKCLVKSWNDASWKFKLNRTLSLQEFTKISLKNSIFKIHFILRLVIKWEFEWDIWIISEVASKSNSSFRKNFKNEISQKSSQYFSEKPFFNKSFSGCFHISILYIHLFTQSQEQKYKNKVKTQLLKVYNKSL